MKELEVGTDFSGIGAPEQALKNLGIPHRIVFSCEIDKHAQKSYEAVHGHKITYKDIRTRDHKTIPSLDLYVAGFPCQAFSLAGKRLGFDDVRGTLFFDVANFIKANRPGVFVLENVKGLISHDTGRTFQTILSLLSDGGGTINGQTSIPFYDDGLGYHIYFQVLDTQDHGLPQRRECIYIVGFKKFTLFQFPGNEFEVCGLSDFLQSKVPKKYYLKTNVVKGHRIPKKVLISSRNKILVARKSRTEEGRKIRRENLRKGVDYSPFQAHTISFIESNIMSTLTTAPTNETLICTNAKIRRLTPMEYWRLQGFPDDALERAQQVNSDTQLYKQAGNSMTVNVIQKIIRNIYEKR